MAFETVAPSSPMTLIHVQVCVLSYRRPAQLQAALDSLRMQTLRAPAALTLIAEQRAMQIVMHVLVVDNDEAASARGTVEGAMPDHGQSLRYVCEPRRGLSAARNRALTESSAMDYIAFLDDDETASPTWLENLLRCAWAHDADVVTGPVDPAYGSSPEWVRRGGFFKAADQPTGKRLLCAASNNTLLTAPIFGCFRFDPRYDATGGEDTDYFLRVSLSGHRIVWAADARVTEAVPESRANVAWILRRAWSDANRYTLAVCANEASPKIAAYRLLVGCGGILTGLLLLPTAIFGKHYGVRALQLIFRAMGTFSALRGKSQAYYATSHG